MPSILRKQLVCALAYQLFLHFLVRLVVKYHTFKDDFLWFYKRNQYLCSDIPSQKC